MLPVVTDGEALPITL